MIRLTCSFRGQLYRHTQFILQILPLQTSFTAFPNAASIPGLLLVWWSLSFQKINQILLQTEIHRLQQCWFCAPKILRILLAHPIQYYDGNNSAVFWSSPAFQTRVFSIDYGWFHRLFAKYSNLSDAAEITYSKSLYIRTTIVLVRPAKVLKLLAFSKLFWPVCG